MNRNIPWTDFSAFASGDSQNGSTIAYTLKDENHLLMYKKENNYWNVADSEFKDSLSDFHHQNIETKELEPKVIKILRPIFVENIKTSLEKLGFYEIELKIAKLQTTPMDLAMTGGKEFIKEIDTKLSLFSSLSCFKSDLANDLDYEIQCLNFMKESFSNWKDSAKKFIDYSNVISRLNTVVQAMTVDNPAFDKFLEKLESLEGYPQDKGNCLKFIQNNFESNLELFQKINPTQTSILRESPDQALIFNLLSKTWKSVDDFYVKMV